MTFEQRIDTANRLITSGKIQVSGVCAIDIGGLVRIDSRDKNKLRMALTRDDGKYKGIVLENPMTWDTFTHIFLLNK